MDVVNIKILIEFSNFQTNLINKHAFRHDVQIYFLPLVLSIPFSALISTSVSSKYPNAPLKSTPLAIKYNVKFVYIYTQIF